MTQPELTRADFVYTIRGEPFLRCFLSPTTEGFLFGISQPSVGDVHLTVFARGGKIRTHIKDSARDPAYVHDRTYTPDILGRRVEARIRRFVKPYHGNMVAWVMRSSLKRKLSAALDFPIQDGTACIPWEVVQGYVPVDLQDERRWRRVHIRDLLRMPAEIGIRIEGRRLYLVRPLDDRTMLKITEGQVEALTRLVLDYLGFVEYGAYVTAKLGDGKARPSVGREVKHLGQETKESPKET